MQTFVGHACEYVSNEMKIIIVVVATLTQTQPLFQEDAIAVLKGKCQSILQPNLKIQCADASFGESRNAPDVLIYSNTFAILNHTLRDHSLFDT